MDADLKKWEKALTREMAAAPTSLPSPDDPIAREVWFTLRALEFNGQRLAPSEIEIAMNRLVDAQVIHSRPKQIEVKQPRSLGSWSKRLTQVVATLRPELTGLLPSLRSGAAGFDLQVFETDRFAVTLASDEEGGRGNILPRNETSLPTDGVIRRLDAAGKVVEEYGLDETGSFRFEVLEPDDRVEIQIGGQWIKLPLLSDPQ